LGECAHVGAVTRYFLRLARFLVSVMAVNATLVERTILAWPGATIERIEAIHGLADHADFRFKPRDRQGRIPDKRLA
jgi:hypothetical protein